MDTFKPVLDEQTGEPTIQTSAIVTQEQGSWKWQVRLCRAYYVARYSVRTDRWIWKSIGHSRHFSGGNWRKPLITPDGSRHNEPLTSIELCALATVRGEN